MGRTGEKGDKALSKAVAYSAMLVVATFLIYANSLSGKFVYDDQLQILNNPLILSLENIPRAFREPFWGFAQKDLSQNVANYYRPFFTLAYMFTYRIWGFNPFYFHLVSVAFHAVLGVMVFFLADEFIRDRKYSALGAFLFIAHPTQTESVAWVGGQCTTLVALFMVPSLYFYLFREKLGRPRAAVFLSGIFFFCGLMSKEAALSVLPLIFVGQMLFDSPKKWRDRMLHLVYFLSIFAVYMAMRIAVFKGFTASSQYETLSDFQVIMSAAHLYAKYLLLFLYPVGLSAYHYFYPVLSPGDWRFLVSAAVLALSLAAMWRLWRKRSVFFYYASIAILTLLPILYIRALGENVFCDRYLYLPLIGLGPMAAHGFKLLIDRRDRGASKWIVYVSIGAICVSLTALTVDRDRDWLTNRTLYGRTLRAAPGLTMLERDYCTEFFQEGDLPAALRCFNNYSRKYPGDNRINFNLGAIYATMGTAKIAEGKTDQALKYLDMAQNKISRSFQHTIRDADIFFNLARIQTERAKIFRIRGDENAASAADDAAIELLKESKKINPDYFNAYYTLGNIFLDRADRKKSEAGLLPEDDPARKTIMSGADKYSQMAVDELKEAVRIYPINDMALTSLGRAYAEQGRCDLAEKSYRSAAKINKNNASALLNLGILYADCLNKPELAVDAFLELIEIRPNDPTALFYLKGLGVSISR